MSVKINEMFVVNENETTTTNTRSLAGTAQLTSIASSIATELIQKIDADLESYAERFEASKTDNNAMDELITEEYDLSSIDVEFLKELDEEVQNSMLKSQQSKRSRNKNKVMTLENYKNMMTGAVSELLLRLAMGKPKTSAGYRRKSGSIEYTAEELDQFEKDQEALKREIRNVQSKKSIMKSKAAFDENDERWVQLLAAEESLKSRRIGGRGGVRTVIVDTTKEQLLEELDGKDINSLKSAEMKTLLKKLLEEQSATEEQTTTEEQAI